MNIARRAPDATFYDQAMIDAREREWKERWKDDGSGMKMPIKGRIEMLTTGIRTPLGLKIAGADPDFHRRDLWESIEAGAFPEWTLSVQAFDQRTADGLDFDRVGARGPAVEAAPPVTESGDKLKAELDDLLDEIDEVLETNAEDFVKSYVQKGGQ